MSTLSFVHVGLVVRTSVSKITDMKRGTGAHFGNRVESVISISRSQLMKREKSSGANVP